MYIVTDEEIEEIDRLCLELHQQLCTTGYRTIFEQLWLKIKELKNESNSN